MFKSKGIYSENYKLKKVWIAILLLLAINGTSYCQWKIIAKKVFSNTYEGWGGAIIYRDGILWSGTNFLWKSLDSGFTWIKLPLQLEKTKVIDWIDVVDFLNKDIGIVGTEYGDLFMTHNGGQTWDTIIRLGSSATSAFLGDSNHILMGHNGTVYSTINEGIIWNVSILDSLSHYPPADSVSWINNIVYLSRGTALAFIGSRGHGGFLSKTVDYGMTWLKSKGFVAEGDSYSFAVDSCDRNHVYLVNENDSFLDDSSRIFLSTDAGESWTAKNTRQFPFFLGSIAATPHAVYCPTVYNGVYRSTDLGETWKSIGGPVLGIDTRRIAAINDNIIIASDTEGSVWRTDNSGGDSIIFKVTPIALSTRDRKTDSIGGLVYVPIVIRNPSQFSFFEAKIQYSDTSRLIYLGTYTIAGKNIDVPDEHWKQGSKIILYGTDLTASSDTVAFSVFRVYPKSEQPCADITFDSIIYIGTDHACNFSNVLSTTANLCSCLNCPTASVLSDLIIEQPKIFIYPNPSANYLNISSDKNLGMVEFEILDILGNIRTHIYNKLGPGHEDQFDLRSFPNGHYILRVSGFGLKESFSFIHY